MTCEWEQRIFVPSDALALGARRAKMKYLSKKGKTRMNGRPHSRAELIQAHERALKRFRAMNASERFASLIRAGIYTRAGKLTSRYGG